MDGQRIRRLTGEMTRSRTLKEVTGPHGKHRDLGCLGASSRFGEAAHMGRRLALHATVDAGPAGDVRADSPLIQKGRRARRAGIRTSIGCHSFRATGITNYLENGGTLEEAQQMAARESPKTTKLYDRTSDQITLDELERIAI